MSKVSTFSVQEIPFSYRGSWFDISPVVAEKTYADDLHLVSQQSGMHPVLRFEPRWAGRRVEPVVTADPACLQWGHDGGLIELVYQDAVTVRLRGAGLGLRIAAVAGDLTPFSGTYLYRDPADGAHVFTSYETGRRYRVTVLAGDVEGAVGLESLGATERHLDLPGQARWEVAIEEYTTARPPYSGTAIFEQVAHAARAEFEAFTDAVASWRGPGTPAAELAAYVLWSATVAPGGFLTRPAVLMSKHWMDKVWSWDHCFNALALAAGDPELAWHQFQLPFDHQDPAGALPDSVAHSEVLHNFVKPPIHGWALGHLRRLLPRPLERPQLTQAYQRLAHWTGFWLEHRRVPGHELPHYQHGNDSGWDNATTFDGDRLLETGDLAAFLTLQLDELASLAAELGDAAAAARWTDTAVRIENGLRRAGQAALADEISRRFRQLCEKSGFAENFDAETGAGLRDRAYTWTASSYLILAAAHEPGARGRTPRTTRVDQQPDRQHRHASTYFA